MKEEPIPPPPKKKKWKMILLWCIFGAIIIGSLLFTILHDIADTGSLTIDPIFNQNWWYLIIALLAAIMYIIFRAISNCFVIHSLTGKMMFKTSLSCIIRGRFYDLVTPLAVGGQPFQMVYLKKKDLPSGVSVTVPLAEYSIHYFAYVVLSIVAIILTATNVFGNNVPMNTTIYVMASIGIALNLGFPVFLILFLISKPACRKVTRFVVKTAKFLKLTKHPDKLYRKIMTTMSSNAKCLKTVFRKKQAWFCFLFAICASLSTASVGYFVIKAFGFTTLHGLGWIEIVSLNILIQNSVSFIPTPGNSGAADLSFWWMFRSVIPGSASIAVLIWRGFTFYFYILIGFIHIVRPRKKSKPKSQATYELEAGEAPKELAEGVIIK